jgi:hypothetical protein
MFLIPRPVNVRYFFQESDFSRSNWPHYLIIFFVTFLVYFWSAPRTVVLEDDGYFILAAYFNGIAHPPGYPLYTFLAHIFTCIPFGSIALRVHLVSGLFASLSCICLWWITGKLLGNRIYAYTSALTLAFSNVFWSQAIISEVYTLNALLVLVVLLLLLVISAGQGRETLDKYCRLIMLVYGLALSNHWPLVILSTPMFVAVIWPRRRDFFYSCLNSIPYFFLGLLPYVWMVLRSQMDPEISFYGPINNLSDLWFYISRQGYHDIDTSISAGWSDKLGFFRFFLLQNYQQFGHVGFYFLVTGFLYQWYVLKKHLCTALILGYLGSSIFLILLLGFDYDQLHRIIFRVYPVISYVIASLWLGIGLLAAYRFLLLVPSVKTGNVYILIILCVLITGTTFASNAPANYRANDRWAERYATIILDSLPANSLLFLNSDVNVGPVGYMNLIAGYRNDIELYSVKGQVFSNRIYQPFKVTYQDVKKRFEQFIRTSTKPVYYTGKLVQDYGAEYYGLYFRVLEDRPKNYIRVIASPEILSYLDYVQKGGLPQDPWEIIHYTTIMSDGCRVLTLIQEYSDRMEDIKTEKLAELRDTMCNNLMGIYIRVDSMLEKEHPDFLMIRKLLDQAEDHLGESRLKAETAYLDYYRGLLFLHQSRKDIGVHHLQQSIRTWNHPDNPAYEELNKLKMHKTEN